MLFDSLHIGILFNAFVSSIIAIVSIAFILYLTQIHKKFDDSMQSYMWFWIITSFVWIFIFIRYLFIAFTITHSEILWLFEILIQAAIFFTGPPMFYYTALSAFRSRKLAVTLSLFSIILALVALVYVILPGGITPIEITFFSAETQVNAISMNIFAAEVVVLLGLLLITLFKEFLIYRKDKNGRSKYKMLYAFGILIYVILGSIDQAKFFIDWYIIVMRLLYAAAFLFVYLTIKQEIENNKVYFLTYNNK